MTSNCVYSFGHSFFSQIFSMHNVYHSPCQDCCCCLTSTLKQLRLRGNEHPLQATFLLLDCAQPLQPLPSAQIGFQPPVGESGYSRIGWCLDGVRSCTGHCSTQVHQFSTDAFHQNVSTAVFDDCYSHAVGSWWEPWGCCWPPCCFLTSLPSLGSCTIFQSTLPLIPSSSSRFLCSLLCTVVLLQGLCTSAVSAAISGPTDSEPYLWPMFESSSSVSQGPLQLLRVALLWRHK